MIRFIYENESGHAIEFSIESDYKLTNVEGLSGNEINIEEASTSGQVGATMSSASVQPKDITFEGDYLYTMERRKRLLSVISPLHKGKLRMIDGNMDVYLEVSPKRTPYVDMDAVCQTFQIVFHASYPYWRSVNGTRYPLMYYSSKFKFPRSFSSTEPWKITEKILNIISNIHNEGVDQIGFEVIMTAITDVVSPELLNIDTQEKLKLKDNFYLKAGESIVFTTFDNKKTVRWRHDGKEENAFKYLSDENIFWKMRSGDNNIRYGAVSNQEGLEVVIYYETTYAGV